MPYNSRFDLDAVLETLGVVSHGFPEGSPQDEALRIAAVALLYVRDNQKLEEYRDYFQRFLTHRPVRAAHVFSTREEAEVWLAGGEARDGTLVSIAGQGFTVIQATQGLKFVRTPLPEERGP